MLVLGIENSGSTCSCALADGGTILGEVSGGLPEHSPVLPGLVDSLLNVAGKSLEEIDLWAISIGPGSFTSLRVGLATVKGLAMASRKPVVSIPTLEAVAREVIYTSGPICALLDARRGEVYYAIYRATGDGLRLLEGPGASSLSVLVERVDRQTLFALSGAAIDRRTRESFERRSIWLRLSAPRASTICRLAAEKFERSGGEDLDGLEPLYVKPSYAEEGGRTRIDRMKRDHLDRVIAIETECFAHPWSRRAFLWELDSEIALPAVAMANNEVAGYLVAWSAGDEMHLGNVAVARRYRGKGVGRDLMKWLVEEARRREMVRVTLEVRASNAAAVSLYKRFGFREIAVRQGYYPGGEDAYLMALDVRSQSL
jgi:tRNA threonylcarbamoyladenosine biosynthesis protein TsaB